MQKSPALRTLMRVAGALLFAASLYYICRTALALDAPARLMPLGTEGVIVTAICALAYGMMLILLALAWRAVAAGEVQPEQKLPSVIAYGRSVLAKYLPGSVFQYASRQVLGMSAGFDQKRMAFSSMIEIVLHVLSASMVAAGLLLMSGLWAIPAAGVFGATALTLAMLATRKSPGVSKAVMLQLAFFCAFAVVAAAIAWLVSGSSTDMFALAGIFLVAWLAGFLVPFAPGGLGIREAAIIALGATIAEPATLLAFAALTRIATLAGDFLFGAVSYLLPTVLTRWNNHASAEP